MASVDPWTPDPKTGKPRSRARWRTPEGKPRSKVCATKREATAYGVKMEADKLAGRYIDPSAGKVTFEEYAEDWLESQVFADSTRRTVASRLRHAYPAFGSKPLLSIGSGTVRSWIRGLGTADTTARMIISYVSAVFSAAVDDEKIQKNPFDARSVKVPTGMPDPVKPFTARQVAAMVDALDPRFAAIPTLIVGCGLRQGEVFGLFTEDIDFLGGWVFVNRQQRDGKFAPPKGGKKRKTPLPEEVGFALAEHIRQFPVDDGPVFRNENGAPIRHHSTFNNEVWKPGLVAAGVDPDDRHNGCHRGRHTFASVLLEKGESVATVAEFMGNTPAVVLRTYAHRMPRSEVRVKRVMSEFLTSGGEELSADPVSQGGHRGG